MHKIIFLQTTQKYQKKKKKQKSNNKKTQKNKTVHTKDNKQHIKKVSGNCCNTRIDEVVVMS